MKNRIDVFNRYSKILIGLGVLFAFVVNCKAEIGADNDQNVSNQFGYNIKSHNLEVNLDVITHSILATDDIEISLTNKGITHIKFMLNSNLKVENIGFANYQGPLEWENKQLSSNVQIFSVKLPDNIHKNIVLKVKYQGEIYDPVIKAQELGHLRGDVTAGLICEDGVYLSASTYWYPVKPNELSLFNISVKIANPYTIVTQGELKNRETMDELAISKWESDIPADGLALVAGKYVVHTKTFDGVKVSTYFFKEDDAMSELFLEAAADYLKIYSDILGPYPYKKFDVVENFFSTGYGMPSYTLLGNYVIKRGRGSLHPGYLDHEIVHSWFGNYVFNDATKGNWVEALTTYCANYYYKELKLSQSEAINHRENASLKYSIRVSKDKDYPVHKFITKTKPFDNEIGYTKGSMIFHQLRKNIGDENFFKGLKNIVKNFGGKYAEWEDLQAVFEDVSGIDLGWFFFQWIDIKGAPELKIENVSLSYTEEGFAVKGKVAQLGNVYKLNIPIHINLGRDTKIFHFKTNEKRKDFEFKLNELPITVSLDPEFHIFRRIADSDITPCFNAFLEDKNDEKLFVYSTSGADIEQGVYRGLAETAKKRTGGAIIPDSKMSKQLLYKSLFLAGDTKGQNSFKTLFEYLPDGVHLAENLFTIDGEKFEGPEYALILTFRNPMDKSNFVTTYFGLSPQAISRAKYIFFYGWDSYVVFKNGRPVKRASFRKKESDTTYNFPLSYTTTIKSENLMNHIRFLASKELAGRYPGTKGDLLATDYIKKKFMQYGISPVSILKNEPYQQQFEINITDLKKYGLQIKNINTHDSMKLDSIPFNFSPEVMFSSDLFFAGYGISNNEYNDYENLEDDVKGKAVIIFDGVPDFISNKVENNIDLLLKKIDTAHLLGAKVLIVNVLPNQIEKYTPYTAYPSRIPESVLEIIKKKQEKGAFSSADLELVGFIEKGKHLSENINMPVVLVSHESNKYKIFEKFMSLHNLKNNINEKNKPNSKTINGLSVELEIDYQINKVLTNNIIGVIEGNHPKHRDEIVVLGAHYDHLGNDKNGNIFFGADDNASGIAALLEIAKTFNNFSDKIKRTLVFVAFGAEEWGLQGSRFFVNNPIFKKKKVVSMLNIDSIGKGEHAKVWIIGSSVYPKLSQTPSKYISEFELKEGNNIDKHAFKYGSDHYPFHLKGIPAIDFFSTNYRELHKITDTWELIDSKKVEKVCKLVFMTLFDLATN